jgi:hypothetical protein
MMENLVPIAPRKNKVVHYHELRYCQVGHRALVWPIDHPAIQVGSYAKTTTVQSFDPLTGVAETANTRYEPGLFAEWSDRREDTGARRSHDFDTIVPAMPSTTAANLKDIA